MARSDGQPTERETNGASRATLEAQRAELIALRLERDAAVDLLRELAEMQASAQERPHRTKK